LANHAKGFIDTFLVSDALTSAVTPERFIKNFEDEISVDDVFVKVYLASERISFDDEAILSSILTKSFTQRNEESFPDGLAIGEIFSKDHNIARIYGTADTAVLEDILTKHATDRYEKSFEEDITISEDFDFISTEQSTIKIVETLPISEVFTEASTVRYDESNDEDLGLTELFKVLFGLIVVGGTGDGNYDHNEIVQLGATVPQGFVFFKWNFNKTGLSNIFDPNATLTVPIGGGVVTAEFIKISDEIDKTVIIYDVFDFTYVENFSDDDEIFANQTAVYSGGTMGVANHDFVIPQGALFHNIVIYKDNNGDPVDITGYTMAMHIRKFKADEDSELEISSSDYLENGGAAGSITISVPGSITDDLDFVWGYYDLELYPNGVEADAIRILEGRVKLSKQVTRQ